MDLQRVYRFYTHYQLDQGNLIVGVEVNPNDLMPSVAKALENIDRATMNRTKDESTLTKFAQEQLKYAVYAEAGSLYRAEQRREAFGLAGGYSIGDVSVQAPKEEPKSALESHYGLCDQAIAFLMPTGLLDRRI